MKALFFIILIAFPAILLTFTSDSTLLARAEEDEVDADDDVDVEGEEDTAVTDEGGDDEDLTQAGASPDADTTILFTKPIRGIGQLELPAGKVVDFLVGFINRGQQDFLLEAVEASFRYPMDFSFHIQNFSNIAYNKVVQPNHETTVAYSFLTPDSYAGRPFGLNIHLSYRDAEGNAFAESVFNETVSVVELDEGLDGETVFLYLFLAAGVILMLVLGQHFLVSVGKKRHVAKKPTVEMGTNNINDVDMEWLPKSMLNSMNKTSSPKNSPRGGKQPMSPKSPKGKKTVAANQQSPRQRKAKRSAGRDD